MTRVLGLAAILSMANCLSPPGILVVIPDDAGRFSPVPDGGVRVVDCKGVPRPYAIVGTIAVNNRCDGANGAVGVLLTEAARRGANYIVEPSISGCYAVAIAVRSLDDPNAPSANLCADPPPTPAAPPITGKVSPSAGGP
jgi:hypothetical protein